jgi:hypothetical protein
MSSDTDAPSEVVVAPLDGFRVTVVELDVASETTGEILH